MLGPSFNPIAVNVLIIAFFVGTGYLAYLFGSADAKRR